MYQNIVPSITKLLDFDRAKTTATILIGSLIPPMGMYKMYCYAALGGGLDGTTASSQQRRDCRLCSANTFISMSMAMKHSSYHFIFIINMAYYPSYYTEE